MMNKEFVIDPGAEMTRNRLVRDRGVETMLLQDLVRGQEAEMMNNQDFERDLGAGMIHNQEMVLNSMT